MELPDAWIVSQISGPQEQDGDLKKSGCVFNFLLQYLLHLARKENIIIQENQNQSEFKGKFQFSLWISKLASSPYRW